MNSGEKSHPCFPSPRPLPGVVANHSPTGPVLKGFYGFYAPERVGKICPRHIPRPVHAGGVCGIGKNRTCGSRRGAHSSVNWIPKPNWIGLKRLPMAVLPRPKKGGLRRENQ